MNESVAGGLDEFLEHMFRYFRYSILLNASHASAKATWKCSSFVVNEELRTTPNLKQFRIWQFRGHQGVGVHIVQIKCSSR